MTDEIEKCPTCGTPKLDPASKTLVLYFATEEDRQELIDAFKEVKPNIRAVPVD